MKRDLAVGLNAAIIAVTDDSPRILTVEREGIAALPYGPLDPDRHPTIELGLRAWVFDQTDLELGYVEQLYTFGDRDRDPSSGDRQLSIVYLALAEEGEVSAPAAWRPIYDFLPWEDWRGGAPAVLDRRVVPTLERWAGRTKKGSARRRRCDLAFGLGGASWDTERVLHRYELLYEAAAVAEAGGKGRGREALGSPMILDHRRMLATALGRLRGKIRYRPVIFELLPPRFTLLALQRVTEALAGKRLHKQNFRRLVARAGLVEGTGSIDRDTGGRPAELFRFRSAVVMERPSPGVGLPSLPASD